MRPTDDDHVRTLRAAAQSCELTDSVKDAIRNVLARLDVMRRLPVIATCGDCAHFVTLYPQGGGECWHPKAAGGARLGTQLHVVVNPKASPPLGTCPLIDDTV